MPRLKILRVSGNGLQALDAAPFANLRTLYADNNSLGEVLKAERLTKLENLSLRNQASKGLSVPKDFRVGDVDVLSYLTYRQKTRDQRCAGRQAAVSVGYVHVTVVTPSPQTH